MRQTRTEAVIHFAAFIAVGESMREPETYFANNVSASLSLLTAMHRAGVKHIVFSSTAAVYGTPHATPILETFPIQPVNPYGESKVMVETMLRWFDEIHHMTSVCLRYFNASRMRPGWTVGRGTRSRNAPDSITAASGADRKSGDSLRQRITLRPTGPASAIIFMCWIWRRRTSWRWNT